MRPGQLTPENETHPLRAEVSPAEASMRPGQLTPENRMANGRSAGTIGASMRPGQLTPENALPGGSMPYARRASMRPGQLTPENRTREACATDRPTPVTGLQ